MNYKSVKNATMVVKCAQILRKINALVALKGIIL